MAAPPGARPLTGPGRVDGGDEEPVFASLADPMRRAVLQAVADEGPLTATELAARLPVSRQAIAKHLDVLRAAGLVRSARDGRDVRFTFESAPLDDAVAWITAVGDRWDRRLADLRDRLAP